MKEMDLKLCQLGQGFIQNGDGQINQEESIFILKYLRH